MAVLNRKNSPTSNTAGDTNISKGTLSKRCSETFDAALRIHGGTASNTVPAAAGLVETLVVKFPQNSLVILFPERESYVRKYFHKYTIRGCRNLKLQSKTNCVVFLFTLLKG